MAGQQKTGRRKVSNLMALSLLSLLTERPMYPYEMASKLREYGKDQAIKINWGSLYTVVQNLEKHGFIEAVEVAREGRQPERTTYRITEAGRDELKDWLRELLSEPEREYTRFEAALGECGILAPDELIGLLRQRLEALEEAIAAHQQGLTAMEAQLPRLFLPRDRGVSRGAHPVPEPGRRTGNRRLSKRPRPGAATPAAGAVNLNRSRGTRNPRSHPLQ
jgi:DNA-binding PadR family transcriptional regulator